MSINGGVQPSWAHNGRELFYREPVSGALMAATSTTDPDISVQSRARLFDASPHSAQFSPGTYDVTSDDQRFVFMRLAVGGARLVLIDNWFEELRERRN